MILEVGEVQFQLGMMIARTPQFQSNTPIVLLLFSTSLMCTCAPQDKFNTPVALPFSSKMTLLEEVVHHNQARALSIHNQARVPS